MSFAPQDGGLGRLRGLVEKYSNFIAHSTGLRIRCNQAILVDAYYAAQTSMTFYKLGENGRANVNHYKEIAHICFWIQKFKPLRVEDPASFRSYIQKFGM